MNSCLIVLLCGAICFLALNTDSVPLISFLPPLCSSLSTFHLVSSQLLLFFPLPITLCFYQVLTDIHSSVSENMFQEVSNQISLQLRLGMDNQHIMPNISNHYD